MAPNGAPREPQQLQRLRVRILALAVALLATFALGLGNARAGVVSTSPPIAVLTSSDATSTLTPASAGLTPASSAIGAIFPPGAAAHSCTGTVISSPGGDLVLTAAHCITGTGAGYSFAPGYSDGRAPHGAWTVVAAYATRGWIDSQRPDDDLVVLRVAPKVIHGATHSIRSVVGSLEVGDPAPVGTLVTAHGYVAGTGGSAITCVTTATSTPTSDNRGVATINCPGFATGTSGGPWLEKTFTGQTLVGIVGGLHQGGCSTDISYSPELGTTLTDLVHTADTTVSGSTLPAPGPSGC